MPHRTRGCRSPGVPLLFLLTVLWPAWMLWAAQAGAAAHVYRIESLESTDFNDLQFLKALLEDVRVVQLGENGHGTSEAVRLRARLARFLHAQMGFNVVAFESSLFLCHLGDTDAAGASAQRTLTRSLIGVWHTEEMLPLFTYLGETRSSDRPLRLAGFDIQPIGGARKERPAFFERVLAKADPEYGRAVRELDASFLVEYDKGSASRRTYLRERASELIPRYEAVASFVDTRMSSLQQEAGREAPLVARQEARSIAAFIRQQASANMKSYAEIRDHAMADNVSFLVDELFAGEKVIVWGHNYHVRHDNVSIPSQPEVFPGVAARSMGSWIRERYKDRVFTIGQYESEGKAVNNAREPYDISSPSEGSLEQRLSSAGFTLAFVDLRRASRTPDGAWLNKPVPARYNGQYPETVVPVDQYDGIVFIRKVTPPKYLY